MSWLVLLAGRVPPKVDARDRVLRALAMLRACDEELHQVAGLPPGATARLERQPQAVRAELQRSLSPALADELWHLVRLDRTTPPTDC